MRVLAGQFVQGEIYTPDGASIWSSELTANIPETLRYSAIIHSPANGGCTEEELTWLSEDGRLRSYCVGDHWGCGSWIENWIDWWFVSEYASPEPGWSSIGAEETGP
jgi:hypothetical protein